MAKPRLRQVRESPSEELALLGEGNSQSKLIFVTSEPSSKPASELLYKMIEAMGLKKENVLIASVTDANTPGSLKFETLRPQIIVSLGEAVSQNLLASTAAITDLRGVFRPFRGIKLIATFHPEDLLKKPDLKKSVWADLQSVAKELGIAIPSRK